MYANVPFWGYNIDISGVGIDVLFFHITLWFGDVMFKIPKKGHLPTPAFAGKCWPKKQKGF